MRTQWRLAGVFLIEFITADLTQASQAKAKSIYELCGGYPQKAPQMNSFSDPYDVEGKCYFANISSVSQDLQWINKNTALTFTISPLNGERSPVIFFDPNGHVKYGYTAVVIGMTPYRYTSALGSLVVSTTFRILKYEDNAIDMDGSGSLGEPVHAVKAPLIYPQTELESNTQGHVELSCQMQEGSGGLWQTHNCKVISQDTKQDFIDSAIVAAYNSTWNRNEIAGIDASGYKTLTYNFTLSEN
mgnify:FL=1